MRETDSSTKTTKLPMEKQIVQPPTITYCYLLMPLPVAMVLGIGVAKIQCIWSSRCMFSLCIPVSSLQYQLIGKLLGSGTHPIGELSQN